MPPNAVSQILARSHVASSGFLAAQDVTIKHSLAIVVHVGLVGFEPTASWSRTRRSTKLSHSPKSNRHSGLPGRRATYFAYFSADGKEIEFVSEASAVEMIGIVRSSISYEHCISANESVDCKSVRA